MLRINYLLLVVIVFASTFTLAGADVWVLVNDLPGADAAIGKEIGNSLNDNGITAHSIMAAEFDEKFLKNIPGKSLLILTDCGILPLDSSSALDEFISKGGKLISLGGTLYRNPVIKEENNWLSQKDEQEKLSKIQSEKILMDFSNARQPWTRNNGTADTRVVPEIVRDSQKGRCLHISIKSINDYDLLFSPAFTDANAGKYDYVCFWAKGGSSTIRMNILIEEKDATAWGIEIPLTKNWKRYVINVKDFTQRVPGVYQSIMPSDGRIFDTSKIKRCAFGQIRRSDLTDVYNHELYISKIELSNDKQYKPGIWDVKFTYRDLLYPSYLTYNCSDVGRIQVSQSQQKIMPSGRFSLPVNVRAFSPRCKSAGYKEKRSHRWIPLLEAVSSKGDYRGTIAALQFGDNFQYMWAGFAIEDAAFYKQKSIVNFVVDLTKRMLNENFIWQSGSSQFTYFPDQEIKIGVSTIINNPSQDLQLKLSVIEIATQKNIFADTTATTPLKYETSLGKAEKLKERTPYLVKTVLVKNNGEVIDQIEQIFYVWQPNKTLGWVTAQNGEFYLDGKIWRPYGVNYMPSSGIAQSPQDTFLFENWFSNEAYDPDVIERDLSHIANMGLNTVCVFIHNRELDSWNFIDFLRLCEKYNLRIDLAFRESMPKLDFQWEKAKEVIEKNRLSDNRTIFAYDLSWEYRFQSDYYDFPDTIEDWNKWILNKYGTIDSAIAMWHYTPEIKEGLVVPPTHDQWYQSGDWNRMMGDFADCLNMILHNHYSIARRQVKNIAPNHLVSFRMQYSGDPTFVWSPLVPYDLKGLANAVDIMEPEAYGRIGPRERVKDGIFTNAYARAVAPALPVFWPEVGRSIWENSTMTTPNKLHQESADFYRNFLNMLLESYANGVAFWWYPGGFRTIENSDYGIINPDGTDRPVTRVIREFAPKFKRMGPVPVPEVWVRYPHDWKPGGIAGAYKEIKNEFWRNIDAGKVTGLKME
ncbi:MAG: carbohydrate binding domain-containing protein [Phycisphaerae bacterium]|jgi:hypothetical protein